MFFVDESVIRCSLGTQYGAIVREKVRERDRDRVRDVPTHLTRLSVIRKILISSDNQHRNQRIVIGTDTSRSF